jgi:hypothetical protein
MKLVPSMEKKESRAISDVRRPPHLRNDARCRDIGAYLEQHQNGNCCASSHAELDDSRTLILLYIGDLNREF